MRRHIIGILGLVLLALGIAQLLWLESDRANLAFLGNSGIRIGLVLGALWLAFPEVKRLAGLINAMPTWLFYMAIGSLFAAGLIKHPLAILLIVPVLFLMWLLKPPKRDKS